MMAKFNLENYETVEDRLKIFWKDNPDGRIETEIVHITTDGTCVTIKAELYKELNDLEGQISQVITDINKSQKRANSKEINYGRYS